MNADTAAALGGSQRPRWSLPVRLAAIAVVLFAAACGLHAVALSASLTQPMPIFDQILVAMDFFRLEDGRYAPTSLLALHNEHRIATTKVLLLADAYLFSMAGYLPIVVAYATCAATAWIIAISTAGKEEPLARATFFAIGTGLLCSTMNWPALTVPFQVQFPLEHLFAAAAFLLFARERSGRNLLLACMADVLAVYSLGSGVFVLVPVVAIAIWQRRADRGLLLFAAVHAALLAAYFLPWRALAGPAPDPGAFWQTTVNVLGWMAAGAASQDDLGFAMLALAVLVLAAATWRAVFTRNTVDRHDCVLLALVLFGLAQALLTGWTRTMYGANARYAMFGGILCSALLGLAWRHAPTAPALRGIAQAGLLAGAAWSMGLANHPAHAKEWRNYSAIVQRVEDELVRGEASKRTLAVLWPPGDLDLSGFLARMAAERMGPFHHAATASCR